MSRERGPSYVASNWYWAVAGGADQVFSSARSSYVPVTDGIYVAWNASGGRPTLIGSEGELWDVLAQQAPDSLPLDIPEAQSIIDAVTYAQMSDAAKKLFFDHENRLRALEKQPVIAPADLPTVYVDKAASFDAAVVADQVQTVVTPAPVAEAPAP